MQQAADIWILSQSRKGDLHQMIDLADATGLAYEVKTVRDPAAADAATNLTDATGSLPRVLISAERAMTPLALALKARSRGSAKAVSIGRPSTRIEDFDLVITAPHFRVPPAANVLELPIPLHRLDRAAMTAAAKTLAAAVRQLPRPYTVALVGGSSGVERLDARAGRTLAQALCARIRTTGGSLLLATSPRTPEDATRALAENLSCSCKLYLWSREMDPNPYPGLLGLADEFVATSDSASMPIEAALTGKPVNLYRLDRRYRPREVALEMAQRCRSFLPPLEGMFRSGRIEARADRRLLFAPLLANGVLRPFAPDAPTWTPAPLDSSVEQAAHAVLRLMSNGA